MDYKIERSKRKTMSIVIIDGEVTVKAPTRIPVADIEGFVAQKIDWIKRKLIEYGNKTENISPVKAGTHILYHGEFYAIQKTDALIRKAKPDGNVLLVPSVCDTRESADKVVAAFLKRTATQELSEMLDRIAAAYGFKFGSFATTNARRQWGSCDGKNNIRLNWRLVMLDGELVKYVILHELSHTLHHDHSAEFWKEVEKHMPDYKAAKKRLKTYSVLTSMYR